jgi:hypothetical protein
MSDIWPAMITTKLRNRGEDAHNFAAHENPATTRRNYDRRTGLRAKDTE